LCNAGDLVAGAFDFEAVQPATHDLVSFDQEKAAKTDLRFKEISS
jgi:hypothetical protein